MYLEKNYVYEILMKNSSAQILEMGTPEILTVFGQTFTAYVNPFLRLIRRSSSSISIPIMMVRNGSGVKMGGNGNWAVFILSLNCNTNGVLISSDKIPTLFVRSASTKLYQCRVLATEHGIDFGVP